MPSRTRLVALAAALLLPLLGCGSSEETYQAYMLPSHIKSAVLHVNDGKGQLRIKYANEVFVAEGKIENAAAPPNFALVRDSDDDKFLKYSFNWRMEINAWVCPECLSPAGPSPIGQSSMLWAKK